MNQGYYFDRAMAMAMAMEAGLPQPSNSDDDSLSDGDRSFDRVMTMAMEHNNSDDDSSSDGDRSFLTARSDGAFEKNSNISEQLKNNDPELTELTIGHRDYVPTDTWSKMEWKTGGEMIGRNTQLKVLFFYGTLKDGTPRDCLKFFFHGIASNRSVQKLELGERCFFGGKIFDMLTTFFENNTSLQSLSIHSDDDWIPESKAFRRMLTTLPKFCSLKHFDLGATEIGDEGIVKLVQALGGHSQLERLDLQDNDIGEYGVWGLAALVDDLTIGNHSTLKDLILSRNPQIVQAECLPILCNLLQSTTSMLESLFLSENGITDDELHILIDALAHNRRLRRLSLAMNQLVTTSGWQEFATFLRNQQCLLEEVDIGCNNINDDVVASLATSLGSKHTLTLLNIQEPFNPDKFTDTGLMAVSHILCNTSSIMGTYSSNHTLQNCYIGYMRNMPTDLKSLLEINRENNKAGAARKKIVKAHFTGKTNMQHFVNMKLGLLPHAIAWMGKCEDETDTGEFWLLYQFVRNMPSFFDFDNGAKPDRGQMLKK